MLQAVAAVMVLWFKISCWCFGSKKKTWKDRVDAKGLLFRRHVEISGGSFLLGFVWIFFGHENSGSQDVPQRDYTFSRGANCHALSILGPDALKIPLCKKQLQTHPSSEGSLRVARISGRT